MKNIHILPTDKPSSLYILGNNELKLRYTIDLPIDPDIAVNLHIYITSDEEIKVGDFVYSKRGFIGKFGEFENSYFDECKKIILTTDQSLIQDGVQAIDDEFLEWFVKNPSCENVKVELIEEIPSGFTFGMFGNDEPPTELVYKIIIPKEEPKQETLEEVAHEMLVDYGIKSIGQSIGVLTVKKLMVNMAKWQAERMYSEEEVFNLCREFAIFVQRNGPSYKKQQEWFEQFKRKA